MGALKALVIVVAFVLGVARMWWLERRRGCR
jgi:hypothetical protein